MTEQPHFDDELTVLTARQVVPLEAIDMQVKYKRRWFLGGAFVVAMLLGAATALVSAYFRLRNAPTPEIQTATVESVSEEPVAIALPVAEEQPVIKTTPAKPAIRNTDKTDRPVIQPRVNEDDDLRRIRDAVLIDQWQERRARRVERRQRAQHNDRDLSNIDEIFEGRRRP